MSGRSQYCVAHQKGLDPSSKPFYAKGCIRCEKNLADKKVTVDMPSTPLAHNNRLGRGGRKTLLFGAAAIRKILAARGLIERGPVKRTGIWHCVDVMNLADSNPVGRRWMRKTENGWVVVKDDPIKGD